MLEVRQVENWNSEQLELSVLIGDRRGLLIVHDAGGGQAPEGRRARVVPAGSEPPSLEFRDVALATNGIVGCNAGLVSCHDAQGLDEGVAKIIQCLHAVGTRNRSVGVFELCVPFREQLIDPLIVNDLIGREDEVVVVDLDVTLGDHAVALGIVDELISLQVKRLSAVDLRGWPEHAARLLGERAFGGDGGEAEARIPLGVSGLREYEGKCKQRARQQARSRRSQRA